MRKIIEGDEDSHVMVDGETETGYCCQIQVDAKRVAEVYLRYDYLMYLILVQEVYVPIVRTSGHRYGWFHQLSRD